MSAEEMQRVQASYQARLDALPLEIQQTQEEIVALSRQLGNLEKQIATYRPMARAKLARRGPMRLVQADDPYDRTQAAWYEMVAVGEKLGDAVRRFKRLKDEKRRAKRMIAYTEYLSEQVYGAKGDSA